MKTPEEALPTRASQHPRVSSLDGIRALAVFAVVAAHIEFGRAVRSGQWRSLHYLTVNKIGQFALIFFFVISGFLITWLLLAELDKTGTISVRRFYFRRAWRIIPPMYFYLLGTAVAVALGLLTINRLPFLTAMTFTTNYCQGCVAGQSKGFWFFGHTWTLAVDAQFYILWPLALAFGGRKRGLQVAMAFLIIAPVLRLLQAAHGKHASGAFFGLEGVADTIALGCILALLRERLHATRWYTSLLGSRFFGLVPVTAVVVMILSPHPSVISIQTFVMLGIPFVSLSVALSLDWAMTYSSRPLGRVLNARPLAYLGAMSYSLYLWHLVGLGPMHGGKLRILLGLLIGAVGGVTSYYIIERPSLRLRGWLEQRIFGARNRGELPTAEVSNAMRQPSIGVG